MRLRITFPLKKRYIFLILISIKLCAILFATLFFSKFTPLVDSNLYLQGYYEIDPAYRTRFINYMAVFFNKIGGPYFAHFIFSMISIMGLIYYFLSGGKRLVLILFLLLPSSFVWTSIVGKEAIFFGASGLILVIWSKYIVENLSLNDFMIVIFCLVICTFLRPHYAISFTWLFFSTIMIKRFKRSASFILLAVFSLGLIIGYLVVWEELLKRGYGGIDPLARASRTIEMGIIHGTSQGYARFKELVILGSIYGVLGPLPSEIIRRVEFLPFFLEGLLIISLPLLVCWRVQYSSYLVKNEFFKYFCWSLLPAIFVLIIVHAPFGLLNPGSASRWRTNFEQIFYLAPLLLFFRLKENGKENNSFPP